MFNKSTYEQELGVLIPDLIKARQVKYIRREGYKGAWRYFYQHEGVKKAPFLYYPDFSLQGNYKEVEDRFARDLSRNFERYKYLYEKQFGRVVNTDDARELSPDYRANRAQMAPAVHEPASGLAKAMFQEFLQYPPQSNNVLFTAGGAGAGKSSGIEAYEDLKQIKDTADVIMDATLAGYHSALGKIKQALASGRHVDLVYVYRDPIEAFDNGVLPRMKSHGRSVGILAYPSTHIGSKKTIELLVEEFKDDDRVNITIIDNSLGKGQAKKVGIDEIKKKPVYKEGQLMSYIYNKVTKLYEDGKITEKEFRGIIRGFDPNRNKQNPVGGTEKVHRDVGSE